jgi:hypothetical protein
LKKISQIKSYPGCRKNVGCVLFEYVVSTYEFSLLSELDHTFFSQGQRKGGRRDFFETP